MGRSLPIISVVISSTEMKADLKAFFFLFLIKKLKQLGLGKKVQLNVLRKERFEIPRPHVNAKSTAGMKQMISLVSDELGGVNVSH